MYYEYSTSDVLNLPYYVYIGVFQHPEVQKWAAELESLRDKQTA